MNRTVIKAIALGSLVLGVWLARAEDYAKSPYPSMAPLDQYLITDRNAEIALARSAAPPSVSNDATVLVLGRNGYETAVEGTNGFVCVVERAWMGSFDNNPEFWNPKNRGPSCFNPAAARTVLPITLMRTKFVLAGQSKDEIRESIKAAVEKRELPECAPAAMTYMLSKQGHLNDRAGHWLPHLMFYVALKDAKTWGAGASDSPILVNSHFNGAPEQVTEFMVPVSEWSDGTPHGYSLSRLRADHFDEDKISAGWKIVRFCLIAFGSVGTWQTINHDRKSSEGAVPQGETDERKNS